MYRTIRTSLGTGLAAALVLGATMAPGAAAMPTDLRAPDTRDAAAGQIVRSGPPSWPANPQPVLRPHVVVTSSEPGFDWGSAGIGAGTVVGALAIGLTGIAGFRHRRVAGNA
jgi:hypothetical protein